MVLHRLPATHCLLSHWWFESPSLHACPIERGPRWPCPKFEREHDWEQGPLNGVYLLNRTLKRRIAVLVEPSMYRQSTGAVLVEPSTYGQSTGDETRQSGVLESEESQEQGKRRVPHEQYFLHLTGSHLPSMSGRAVTFVADRATGHVRRESGTVEGYDGGKAASQLLRRALLRAVSATGARHISRSMSSGSRKLLLPASNILNDLVRHSTSCLMLNGSGSSCEAAGLSMGRVAWYALNQTDAVRNVWRQSAQSLPPRSEWTASDQQFCHALRGLPSARIGAR